MNKLRNRVRPDILALEPYPSARFLTAADSTYTYLDANELPYAAVPGRPDYGRYPGQQPVKLTEALSRLYAVDPKKMLICRGADEAIDVLVRTFCVAGQDSILICPPAFPMYAMSATWQQAGIVEVPLNSDFQLDMTGIRNALTPQVKLIFLTTPNNPTGNLLNAHDIVALAKSCVETALVVVDETYIEFTKEPSCIGLIDSQPNICVLRTLSKSYGLAGLRCGVMILEPSLKEQCAKVLPPYPLPVAMTDIVLATLNPANRARLESRRDAVLETRDRFLAALSQHPALEEIYPAAANFVLTRWHDADAIMKIAREAGFILRRVKDQPAIKNGIRISIGTDYDMDRLLAALFGHDHDTSAHRRATVIRTTKETCISVDVDLDAEDPVHIATGVGFFDHMMEQVARHGGFSLDMECLGDLHIDSHHTVEDCAIALGQALKSALGNKAGIGRYGFTVPMDESLAHVAIDLSGRPYLSFTLPEGGFPAPAVGDLHTDMVEHIFRSLADALGATIHVTVTGENTHHMVEAIFKGLGRSLRQAIRVDGQALPSTKGVL
jgi:histidinol-phosphate aminotransferase